MILFDWNVMSGNSDSEFSFEPSDWDLGLGEPDAPGWRNWLAEPREIGGRRHDGLGSKTLGETTI